MAQTRPREPRGESKTRPSGEPAAGRSARRDHLVDVALELFCREGFHIGIDRILAEAGVAKMTLYKHFRSKDDLILEALRRRDEQARVAFVRGVEERAESPEGQLTAMFDAIGKWCPDSRCCPFVGAVAEFQDQGHPVHAAAAENKRFMVTYVRGLAEQAGVAEPAELAEQLVVLLEGAQLLMYVRGEDQPAVSAKAAADVLVREALARGGGGASAKNRRR